MQHIRSSRRKLAWQLARIKKQNILDVGAEDKYPTRYIDTELFIEEDRG